MQSENFGLIARGNGPVLVVAPHIGTGVPAELLTNPAWAPIDGRLSDPAGVAWIATARKNGMSTVSACIHPCVIDPNVATNNRSLSPRLNRVGLCRTHTSRGEPLYPHDCEPDEAAVAARIAAWWLPFHQMVTAEIVRLREMHENIAVLFSHASSWLSPYREQAGGTDFNLGTHHGAACDRRVVAALTDAAQEHGRSWVVNGKLGGVFAAQHYGVPESGVHVVEVEIAGKWRSELEASSEAGLACDSPQDDMAALLDRAGAAVLKLPAASDDVLGALDAARCTD
ncbi:N-formylglutamate amidohydrolase [Paraburkholderia tagetis]|uniref:N-formylglutamate amidohydrolase n=1 Tax=Paraburkholderia tagetis TaxID=2913261 RepID=A0A9X1RQ05_9BURK|nr:N-formylglutamate amidohydrolase [Paraburkholderia tagetis]MCG5073188.1 N-formylglutamate amidohydrolase [Paraburkholderia tagetis]